MCKYNILQIVVYKNAPAELAGAKAKKGYWAYRSSKLQPTCIVGDCTEEISGITSEASYQRALDQDILVIVNPEWRGDGEYDLVLVHCFGSGCAKYS